jgi:hypothetical protein
MKDKKKKPRKKIIHIVTGVIEDDTGLVDNGLVDNGLVDNGLVEVDITPSLTKEKKQKPKFEFDIIDDNIEEGDNPVEEGDNPVEKKS